MNQNRNGLILLAIVCAILLLSSCATYQKTPLIQSLKEQGNKIMERAKLPEQVIVYREKDVSGFSVEYGVLRLKGTSNKDLVLEYIDPAEQLDMNSQDILIYFKVDVYNPTGKIILVTQEKVFNDEEKTVQHNGGNAPHVTFYFYVRIPKVGEEVRSKILLQLENSQSFIETLQLICKFKQQQEQEKGGDD